VKGVSVAGDVTDFKKAKTYRSVTLALRQEKRLHTKRVPLGAAFPEGL
jgi:hypothetical protein